jgi:hypothetical protein
MTHYDNYRDQLVQIIKDVGQEIIDRAESMVDKDVDLITNFNISVDIPQPVLEAPSITWSTQTLVKNFVERECGWCSGTVKGEGKINSVILEGKDGTDK